MYVYDNSTMQCWPFIFILLIILCSCTCYLCRTQEFVKIASPSCTSAQTECHSFESRSTDMATVPQQELSRPLPSTTSLGSSQSKALDFSITTNIVACSKARAGMPLYSHYNMEQPLGHWSGTLAGQYSSSTYPHPHPHTHNLMSEHNIHPSGYHHSNMAEWSQYSLFSYSC